MAMHHLKQLVQVTANSSLIVLVIGAVEGFLMRSIYAKLREI
jgi:hypothetical protein